MNDGLRISRILVPVDGSVYSRHAAQHAVRFAQCFAAGVTFLHVVSDILVAELAPHQHNDGERRARERLAVQGQAYVDDVAHLADEAGVPHQEVVREGDPCAVICETATHIDADLIIMGKIGHPGARRILMGSIARRVIECSDRPVLIVGTAPPADETRARS
jgi:nucleotide-binding universal stress UspA family protein